MRYPANQRGFTLLELMTVVAIVGIMAALSVGTAISQRARSNRAEVSRAVYAAFNVARSEAIRRNRRTAVAVDVDAKQIVAFVDADRDGERDADETVLHQYPSGGNIFGGVSTFPPDIGMEVDGAFPVVSDVPVMSFSSQGFAVNPAGGLTGGTVTVRQYKEGTLDSIHDSLVEVTIAGAVRVKTY